MKWLGFIVLLALLIPIPVLAIGVSPYTANISVSSDNYTELVFAVTGSNEVDIYLEGIPLTVEPNHTSVVDNKITVRISDNTTTPSGTYNGYLVILESGEQVGAGVKVSLTVNYTNKNSVALTTTVVNESYPHDWSSSGGYGSYYTPPATNPTPATPSTTPTITPIPEYVPPFTPTPVTTPTYVPPVKPPVKHVTTINWWLIGMLIVGIVFFGWLIWYLRSRHETKQGIEEQTPE